MQGQKNAKQKCRGEKRIRIDMGKTIATRNAEEVKQQTTRTPSITKVTESECSHYTVVNDDQTSV